MAPITTLIDNGTMVALGWTILHFCWQGTAIAVLYAVADRLTVKASAHVRYTLALVAMALMPLAAIGTYFDQSRLVVHVSQDGHMVAASQLGGFHDAIVKQIPMATPVVEESEIFIAWNGERILPWVDGIWLCGVLLLALRAAGGWWQLERVRNRATGIVPAELQQRFARIQQQLRIGQRVALRLSDEVVSPLAMGVWRAAVILPVSILAQLDPEELESVLAHELAHVRRWDYVANLLQTAIESVLFFHPAVWWLSNRTRHLRETCCDAVAARMCDDPVVYAQALLRLEEQRSERLRLAVALNNGQTPLLGRVKQILGEGIAMESGMKSGVQAAVAGAVVVGLMMAPKMAEGLNLYKPSAPTAPMIAQAVSPAPVATPSPRAMTAVVAVPSVEAQAAPVANPEPVANAEALPPIAAIASASVQTALSNVFNVNTDIKMKHMNREAFMQDASNKGGANYLKEMEAAGYPMDLDKDLNQIVAARSVGVTPEYAKQMAQAGMGKPTLRELVSMKSVGVTPEYLAGMKNSGLSAESFRDVISVRSLGVTPEYAKSMAGTGLGNPTLRELTGLKAMGITPEYVKQMSSAGFEIKSFHDLQSLKALGVDSDYAKQIASIGLGTPSTHDLTSLKAVGITPEYAAGLKQSGINVESLHDLTSFKAVGVTPEYAKQMKALGFNNLTAHELVSMKAQGVTPEYATWVKKTFPDADMKTLRQAGTFHIDEAFIAKAKSHGFNGTSLDKLVKLKTSGLLED